MMIWNTGKRDPLQLRQFRRRCGRLADGESDDIGMPV